MKMKNGTGFKRLGDIWPACNGCRAKPGTLDCAIDCCGERKLNPRMEWPPLIESSGEKGLQDWKPGMEGIGGWTRESAPSPSPDIKPGVNIGPLSGPGAISTKEVEEAISDVDYFLRSTSDDGYQLDDARIGFAVIKAALSKPVPTSAEREELLEHFNEWSPVKDSAGRGGCYECDKIRALILAPLRPKVVTRERVRHWIPCTCIDDYKLRDRTDPTCAYHSTAIGWEDLLNELGIEVQP